MQSPIISTPKLYHALNLKDVIKLFQYLIGAFIPTPTHKTSIDGPESLVNASHTNTLQNVLINNDL